MAQKSKDEIAALTRDLLKIYEQSYGRELAKEFAAQVVMQILNEKQIKYVRDRLGHLDIDDLWEVAEQIQNPTKPDRCLAVVTPIKEKEIVKEEVKPEVKDVPKTKSTAKRKTVSKRSRTRKSKS